MDTISVSLLAVQSELNVLCEKQNEMIEFLHRFKDEILVHRSGHFEESDSKNDLWASGEEYLIDPPSPVGSIRTLNGKREHFRGSGRSASASSLVQSTPEQNCPAPPMIQTMSQSSRRSVESESSKRFRSSMVQRKTLVTERGVSSDLIGVREAIREAFRGRSKACCENVVAHPVFDACCGLIICFNAILVGVETEYLAQEGSTPNLIEVMQLLLNIWYMVEILLRLMTFRIKFWLGDDRGWNIFDVLLVSSSILDFFLSTANLGNLKTARVLRVVRLFRIVRALRIMRTLRYAREFRKMVFSLVASVQTLFWSLLLVMAIVYSFGLWFTQSAAHARDHDENVSEAQWQRLQLYYSSCSRTMYSLFAAITGGYSWHVMLDPWLDMHYSLSAVFFILYISAGVFGLLNIVTSVFVESAMYATKHFQDLLVDARKRETEMYLYHMKKIFREMDADSGGTINFKEMSMFLKKSSSDSSSDLPQYLDALGINSTDIWVLFKLLDQDGSGMIDIDEFCDGCMRLKGEAKSFDINCMIYESRAMVKYHSEFMNFVEDMLQKILAENSQIAERLERRLARRLKCLMPTTKRSRVENDGPSTPRVTSSQTPPCSGSLAPRGKRHNRDDEVTD